MSGRIIRSFNCSGNQSTVMRNELPAGMYFIRAQAGEQVATTKIVFE